MANGNASAPEAATPPHAQLVQMATGHWVSRRSGLRLNRIVPTASAGSLVEAFVA